MKHVRKFSISRASIISIIAIAVILFSISSIEEKKENVVFEVAESKITISGSGNTDKWKMEASSVNCSGDFEVSNHQLLTITDLGFAIPINVLKSNNHQLESTINDIFKKNNCDELKFKQTLSMVLPVMKKIHVIGEINMLNGKYILPLQVSYELNSDQTLRIQAKQTISLSQCGVNIPSYLAGTINDEVELEIDLLLVNKTI
ncbi:YceI family protein [Pedobacter boryungensis]|uniref:YceI family protein n=1 Tax=Pedobacter boryungensis TaxID=869962 RepID=A0ABX2DBY8_9SPHI|nr:YceI family protein [Pedobacter boryungensis]NQX31593.1 YceI family protein [Pedobacter boryungensis]